MSTPHVYILASWNRAVYIGVTTNLRARLEQHRCGAHGSHTARYRISRLVHIEEFGDVLDAIRREKELKGWRRHKKIALIERDNPEWKDLSMDWRTMPAYR
ncbi:MAG: GIY-YIG nuclease family protein [Pseudomonadota bacterium]